MDSNFEQENFIPHYQKCLFTEANNELMKAQNKRKCLMIKTHAVNYTENDSKHTKTRFLENDLQEYSDIIDQREKSFVNNYTDVLSALTSNLKISKPQTWKSGLFTHNEHFNDLIKSVKQDNIKLSDVSKLQNYFKSREDKPFTEHIKSVPEKINFGVNVNSNNNSTLSINQSRVSNKRPFGNFTRRNAPKPNVADNKEQNNNANGFLTARQELIKQNINNNKQTNANSNSNQYQFRGVQKKTLGVRYGVTSKFVPPDIESNEKAINPSPETKEEEDVDPRLKNIDPKMVELIRSEIMETGNPVSWDDIAGLEFAKKTIQEIVVWPLLRPDIFTGLRRPPRGILLFGPPGTGKTLIGKCIASQSQSTFFSISASSLTSKWIGDGEKMVRALFAVARCHQPAVIFIDEIDSLLTQRSDTEHESSRRMKTEFLIQLDGAGTAEDDRILIIGATNRPQELDEAARRRLVKRLYIPLPEYEARKQIVERLMSTEKNTLSEQDIEKVATLTDGYSGADMKNLCAEASLGPIRSIHFSMMDKIHPEEVRPINFDDFKSALNRVRASVSTKDLEQYVIWDKTYGSGAY